MEIYECLADDKAPLFLDAEQEPDLLELEEVEEVEEVEEAEEIVEAAGSQEEIKPKLDEHFDDAIKQYLHEIHKHKLLTAAEERTLAAKIDLGDKAARDQMIVCNLRLVVNIAKRYMNRGLPLLDLIEEGNLGLIKAVERFKLSKECRFSTYATWWIRQSVERALMNQSRTVRLPVHVHDEIGKMHKATYQFQKQMNRDPTLTEVADTLEVDETHVRRLKVLLRKSCSIDQPTGVNNDFFLIDMLEDTSNISPVTQMEGVDTYEMVTNLMETFTEAEKKILTLRFGLDDKEPQTLDTIGRSFGVTRERIRQIETQLLARLRRLMEPPADNLAYH